MNARHPTDYETDFFAWATEQAALLRSSRLSDLDVENVAEEIEDLARNLKRELSSRLKHLIAHLLKWRYQPDHRTPSWRHTIHHQRDQIEEVVKEAPILRGRLSDAEWMAGEWRRAVKEARQETHQDVFPDELPWTVEQILDEDFLPD